MRKGYARSVDIVLFPSILACVWLTPQILEPQIQRAYYMAKPRKAPFSLFYLLQPWHFRRDCIVFPQELSSLGAILALNLLLISGPWFLSSWASFSGPPLLVLSSQALTLKYKLNTYSREWVHKVVSSHWGHSCLLPLLSSWHTQSTRVPLPS